MEDKTMLRQNLEEKGKFQGLYQMYLLFREQGKRPQVTDVMDLLKKSLVK